MDPATTDLPPAYVFPNEKFGAAEYAVFATILVLSAAIGVYHAFFGPKQDSTAEYLLGGRQMSVLPVALSLLCSFVSAITLLGNPVEVYFYGTQYWLIAFSFIPMTLIVMYLYVPVFFRLSLTSANEYFQLRFNSRVVRVTVSIISIVYLIIYMSITVYGPSLALSQVAGINKYLSTGTIFVVCIFYSSLGGLKAVLWTDALQAVVMLVSLSVVAGKGITDAGGLSEVWDLAKNTSRVEFLNWDTDFRTRHTVWTEIIGGCLAWLPLYAGTQSQIQRYCSLPTLAKARLASVINMFGLMTIVTLCFFCGMVIYARFHDCDPLAAGRIDTSDQLLPLLVMVTLGEYPGLPGLFVAGLTCASLSSVSSGLNALSAIITEDYVKRWKPELTDSQLAMWSKFVAFGFGVLSFGTTFLAELLGSIYSAGFTLVGTLLGPTLGIFTLGIFFPFANAIGSLLGLIFGTLIMGFLAVGSIIANDKGELPNQKLPLSTDGCAVVIDPESLPIGLLGSPPQEWKDRDDSALLKFFSLAPNWYPGFGFLTTVVLGVIFSLITIKSFGPPVNPTYLSTPTLKLWCKILPKRWMDQWIDWDADTDIISSNNNNEVSDSEKPKPENARNGSTRNIFAVDSKSPPSPQDYGVYKRKPSV